MNNNKYIYTILLMVLNIKNIFLTTSLSFLLGFYSICHLFIYIKRIEDIGNQNRSSFKEINFVINEYENKYNKLQFEIVSLRSEIDKLKKVVKNIQKNVDSSKSFISPLSVSSLGTLDLSIDDNNENTIVCDELCNFNDELNEFHNLRSQGTSFTSNLVDDSNIDFDSDCYKNNNNDNDNDNDNDNNENNIIEENSNSIDSVNYLKSIFGYEMIDSNKPNNICINNNNNENNIVNNQLIKNNFNFDNLDINRIIKDDNSVNSYDSKSRKRSLSVSDVNWVGLTKKFIFG